MFYRKIIWGNSFKIETLAMCIEYLREFIVFCNYVFYLVQLTVNVNLLQNSISFKKTQPYTLYFWSIYQTFCGRKRAKQKIYFFVLIN